MPLHNKPVRISLDLVRKAFRVGWYEGRSAAQQLEYSARLGMRHTHGKNVQIADGVQSNAPEPPPPHPDDIPDFFHVRNGLDKLYWQMKSTLFDRNRIVENYEEIQEKMADCARTKKLLNEHIPETLIDGEAFMDRYFEEFFGYPRVDDPYFPPHKRRTDR